VQRFLSGRSADSEVDVIYRSPHNRNAVTGFSMLNEVVVLDVGQMGDLAAAP
jgi:hypothetical protein